MVPRLHGSIAEEQVEALLDVILRGIGIIDTIIATAFHMTMLIYSYKTTISFTFQKLNKCMRACALGSLFIIARVVRYHAKIK